MAYMYGGGARPGAYAQPGVAQPYRPAVGAYGATPRMAGQPSAYGQPGMARPSAYGQAGLPAGYGQMAPQVARAGGYAQAGYAQAGMVGSAPGTGAGMMGMPQMAGAQRVDKALLDRITKLLADRQDLKTAVVKSFKAVAGGQKTVDINGLLRIRREVSQKINVPEHVFGNIQDEYVRFDFDGSGFLEANEVYKLIKWHLYETSTSAGGGQLNIPQKTLQQAGFTVTKELGSGNQADIKLACDRYGNQRCVKLFKKSSMQFGNLQEMQDEFETMQLLACKNIARTFEIFQDPQHVYMVNEVYWGGDLTKVEQNARKKGVAVSEDWWRGIFRQCFEALQFMHQQAMMHCDIKEPNLMLRNENYGNPQVVLIDFGVATAMTAKDTGNVSGTPGYMPPETMNQGKWYPGGDVFSMGVAMMQLMTNKIPDEALARQGKMIGIFLEGCTNIEDVKRVTSTRQPPFQLMPKQYPGLTQLCMRCLEKNPRSRPRAPVALKDPWFGVGAAPDMTPVEQKMMPQHPMATVGITDEMLQATPATQAIPDMSAPMPGRGIAPGANY